MIEINRLPHLIYICFFYIFITYVFFIRGSFFATDVPFSNIINNSTIIIPFSTVILILYYIINTSQYWFSNTQHYHYRYRKFNVLKPSKSYFLLFLSILLSFFVNFFITGKHESENLIRFLLEIILNFLVIYIGYYSVRQITSIEKIFTTIQISSLISIWAVLSITSKVEKVRRIGVNPDAETGLSVAVAQLGHALAIVAIISTFRVLIYWSMLAKKKHNKILLILNIVMVFLSVIGMLLTGSKGSLVGFFTYPILLIVLNINRKKIWQYFLFYSGLTIFILLVLILFLDFSIFEGKYDSLLRRYTLEGFTNGFESRLEVFQATFDSIGNMNHLIFGKMWGYQPISNDLSNHIIYPHNIFLSILLHLGILPLISFAFIIFRIIYEFFLNQYKLKSIKILTVKDQLITYNWFVYVTIFAIFLVAFIHVLKGGRLTRVITIFFILGLLEGYNDNLKNYFKKVKQYKNKIRYIKT